MRFLRMRGFVFTDGLCVSGLPLFPLPVKKTRTRYCRRNLCEDFPSRGVVECSLLQITTIMSSIRHSFFLTLFLAVAFAGVAVGQQRYDYEDVIEKQIPGNRGETLTVRSDVGSIQVIGAPGSNTIDVRIIKGVNDVDEDEAEDLFDRFRVTFDESGSGVEIRGDYERGSFWRFRRGLQVRYEIRVPDQMHVALSTNGGSISIEKIGGDARLATSGGSIKASDVNGHLAANTSGGSVSASGIAGEVALHTSGGSITVEGVDGNAECNTSGGSITANDIAGDLKAHTSGGSIRLQTIGGEVDASTSGGSVTADLYDHRGGPISLKTTGGSVTVGVDAGINAMLDAHATGGRVNSELPVAGTIERGRIRGEVNGGGPLLSLRTTGGSINIRTR